MDVRLRHRNEVGEWINKPSALELLEHVRLGTPPSRSAAAARPCSKLTLAHALALVEQAKLFARRGQGITDLGLILYRWLIYLTDVDATDPSTLPSSPSTASKRIWYTYTNGADAKNYNARLGAAKKLLAKRQRQGLDFADVLRELDALDEVSRWLIELEQPPAASGGQPPAVSGGGGGGGGAPPRPPTNFDAAAALRALALGTHPRAGSCVRLLGGHVDVLRMIGALVRGSAPPPRPMPELRQLRVCVAQQQREIVALRAQASVTVSVHVTCECT